LREHIKKRELNSSQSRRIAINMLQRERANHTLESNALIQELSVRLAGSEPIRYRKIHLFAVSAQRMRRNGVEISG